MPSLESPSFSSSRVQRAYRINNVEQIRLQGRLHLLEKEKIHNCRVTNQDIRVISLTLDYIQTCSGKSPEGIAADSDEEAPREEGDPCFLYGERIISRQVKRKNRPQSAFEQQHSSRRDSETSSVSSITASTPSISERPMSSPVRRKPTFVTTFKDAPAISDDESVTSGSSTPKAAWMDETTDVTKKIIKAQSGELTKREAVHKRDFRLRSQSVYDSRSLGRRLRTQATLEMHDQSDQRPETAPVKDAKQQPYSPDRSARLTDILNQRRPTLSASAWKTHLNQSRTVPLSVAGRKQQMMDLKLKLNEDRQLSVNRRVEKFIKKYPRKHSPEEE